MLDPHELDVETYIARLERDNKELRQGVDDQMANLAEIARLEAERDEALEALRVAVARLREAQDVIASYPEDALGTYSQIVTAPDGRSVEMERPIGDIIFADLTGAITHAERVLSARGQEEGQLRHGSTCPKAPHDNPNGGYLHGPDDDSPFNDDGVTYCGRCHQAL